MAESTADPREFVWVRHEHQQELFFDSVGAAGGEQLFAAIRREPTRIRRNYFGGLRREPARIHACTRGFAAKIVRRPQRHSVRSVHLQCSPLFAVVHGGNID